MNLIAKVGAGTGAIVGASGVGYGIYHSVTSENKVLTTKEDDSSLSTQNTKTIKDSFKLALINFDSERDLVNSKLKKLRDLNSIPAQSRFKAAYDKEKQQENSGFEELKKECNEIYGADFTDRTSEIFRDFQTYCARTIKDQIKSEAWAGDDANWKDKFEKLKTTGRIPLSQGLIAIAAANSNDGLTLKKWCTDTEGLIFEGEDNLSFRDAKASCGKAD